MIVSGEGHIVCGRCRSCRSQPPSLCPYTSGVGVSRPGCFAEYIVIPNANVWHHHDGIDLDSLPRSSTPMATPPTALQWDMVGEDVLITGAGPVGAMAAAIAKHVGARHVVITDINDYRLALAKKVGATRTINVSKETIGDVQKELGMTEGFDVGLEMSGAPNALSDMIDNMAHGGKISVLGILRAT
ncbi:MAG: zinc-binding dehydrogenase [Hyphomonadaceae bacterium]